MIKDKGFATNKPLTNISMARMLIHFNYLLHILQPRAPPRQAKKWPCRKFLYSQRAYKAKLLIAPVMKRQTYYAWNVMAFIAFWVRFPAGALIAGHKELQQSNVFNSSVALFERFLYATATNPTRPLGLYCIYYTP